MSDGPSASSFSPGPRYKLGAMKKKCGGFKQWALRYLILDKDQMILYYYHTPKDAAPRRSLQLSQCAIAKTTEQAGPGFKVSLSGSRDFIFVGTNAAIVDDWITAILQAKSPGGGRDSTSGAKGLSPTGEAGGGFGGGGVRSPTSASSSSGGASDGGGHFSYNGPTLAVLPSRTNTGGSPLQPPGVPNLPAGLRPGGPTAQSANSTASTASDTHASNNNTLVGNQRDADTNSTLVAAQGGPNAAARAKVPAGQPVPVIVMTPDNKKFAPIERPVFAILKIGRYVGSQAQSDDMITFKSKVISRNHAEIWSVNTEVYIRDTRSQSGTFLNAMRLSEPGKESKPYRLKPGDVIQFGVDYKGATEDNARCISVRVDLKTKVLEPLPPPPSIGMRQPNTTGKEETLVGGNDGATLIGGNTRNTTQSDRTLVGNGGQKNDDTLYGAQNAPHNNGNNAAAPPPMPGMMRPPMMGVPGMQMGFGGPPMMGRPPMMGGPPPMMGGPPQMMGGGPPPGMMMMGRPPVMGGPTMGRPPMMGTPPPGMR